MQRKIWTPEQDKILREIIQVRKIKKWCAISRAMEVQYKMPGRSGKQCRQRWHNQLDPKIKNQQWTEEQEQKLFRLHDQLGNKWAKIAFLLAGRTDNCVKNHFYSTLRKAIRRLNKFINQTKNKGQMKQIKNSVLSKIIIVAVDKFQKRLDIDKKLVQSCIQIKKNLISFIRESQKNPNLQSQERMRFLIKQIMNFNQNYKKKKSRKVQIKQKSIQIYKKPSQISKRQKSSRNLQRIESKKSKGSSKQAIKQKKVSLISAPLSIRLRSLRSNKQSLFEGLQLKSFVSGTEQQMDFYNIFKMKRSQIQNQHNFVFNGTQNNISLDQSKTYGISQKLVRLQSQIDNYKQK